MKWAIVLMVVSLLILGCSGSSSVPVDGPSGDADMGSDTIEPTPPADTGRTLGTFRDVMAWGQSAHCTWDLQVRGAHMVGEMWIDDDKWKQVMTTEEQLINSIGDGQYMYMWGPEMPGMKIPMSLHEMEESADAPSMEMPSGPEMDMEYNYDCEPMSVPASVFVPPTDVEFQDIGEMMAAMGR